jgi:hypothetical protein
MIFNFNNTKTLINETDNIKIKGIIQNGSKEDKLLLTQNLNLNPQNFLLLTKESDFDIRLSLIGNKNIPFKILQNMSTKLYI